MQVSTRLRQPVERPGPLQLAIREWQRMLIEKAEVAQRQANDSLLSPASALHPGPGPRLC